MKRGFLALAVLVAPAWAHAAVDCSTAMATRSQPLQSTLLAPVASELVAPMSPLGGSGGVLGQAFDEAQSVDQVLLRIKTESCRSVASAVPATGGVNPNDPAAYKPRTQFDNTPWRFNMSQNGKNMTADEFSAWMQSRGVRVAKGGSVATVPPSPGTTPATTSTAPSTAPAGTPAAPPVAPVQPVPAPTSTKPG